MVRRQRVCARESAQAIGIPVAVRARHRGLHRGLQWCDRKSRQCSRGGRGGFHTATGTGAVAENVPETVTVTVTSSTETVTVTVTEAVTVTVSRAVAAGVCAFIMQRRAVVGERLGLGLRLGRDCYAFTEEIANGIGGQTPRLRCVQ